MSLNACIYYEISMSFWRIVKKQNLMMDGLSWKMHPYSENDNIIIEGY